MQQTQTYKLNLIEMSDTFSPAPLNENAQKLEAALSSGLSALESAQSGADAALDARITVLEGHKLAAGFYTGTGPSDKQTISLGFTPSVVFAQPGNNYARMTVRDRDAGGLAIVDGGFQVSGTGFNAENAFYFFCAIC